jgi:Ni,Fe-hydrogenase I cytochrome b subunit
LPWNLGFHILSPILRPLTGTFCLILHTQTATSHIFTKPFFYCRLFHFLTAKILWLSLLFRINTFFFFYCLKLVSLSHILPAVQFQVSSALWSIFSFALTINEHKSMP